jgi:hypothetical protein
MGNNSDAEVQENRVGEVELAVIAGEDTETGEAIPILAEGGVIQTLVTTSDGNALTDALDSVGDATLRVTLDTDDLQSALDQNIEAFGGAPQSAVDVADRINQLFGALASQAGDSLLVDSNNALDVSAATVTVTDDGALAIDAYNGGTLPTEQQSPVGVEDSGGSQIDPATAALEAALASNGGDEFRIQENNTVDVDVIQGNIDSLSADREFTATFRSASVNDGNVAIDAVVSNPGGSGVNVILDVDIVTGGFAELDFATDITIDAAGTGLDEIPDDVGSGTTSTPTVEQGGSYTTNGTTLQTLLPGSVRTGGPATSSGSCSNSSAVLLRPGNSVRYQVTNASGGGAQFAIECNVLEISA